MPQSHFESASYPKRTEVFELLVRQETRTMTGGMVQISRLRVWCMAVSELRVSIYTFYSL